MDFTQLDQPWQIWSIVDLEDQHQQSLENGTVVRISAYFCLFLLIISAETPSHDCTNHQLKQARQTAEKLRDNLLPQFFLRRMKSLIAHQLPKKTDKVVFCPLTSLQKKAYESFLESPLVETVRTSADDCDCGKG